MSGATPDRPLALGGGAPLLDAKRALRERVQAERDRIAPADRERASEAIVSALITRGDFRDARTVLLTLAFRTEWDTRALLAAALARNKTVAAPRVNTATRMLELFAIAEPGRDIATGFHGIPEPASHCAPVPVDAVDWVLVPGVAFDAEGRRIGYGGGYYDRLLPLLRSDARRIAGAFEAQIVGRVPVAPHDLAVEAIVTERRTIECEPSMRDSR